jgi:peroxiredoxin
MSRHLLWAAVCLAVAAGVFVKARSTQPPRSEAVAASPGAADARREPAEAPEFPAGLEWLQGGSLKMADLRGRVAVVHFWTNGCINCIHNYPVYRAWQAKYDAKKVAVIGIHTPEFAREAATEVVRKKAADNGLTFPIVLDPASKAWRAWHNRYWPSIYLVDKKGRVRHRWEGELHLDTEEGKRFAAKIDDLLDEKP